jgi:hypothetical protein
MTALEHAPAAVAEAFREAPVRHSDAGYREPVVEARSVISINPPTNPYES